METNDKPFVPAKVFEVEDMPVCDDDQKLLMEASYKDAMEYGLTEQSKAELNAKTCTCALIIRLLNGTATRTDQILLAAEVASDMYKAKHGIVNFMDMLRRGMAQMQDMTGFPEPPPYPGDKKKTWLN
jgi:hypothetical protein